MAQLWGPICNAYSTSVVNELFKKAVLKANNGYSSIGFTILRECMVSMEIYPNAFLSF